jgi:hypothetical protein
MIDTRIHRHRGYTLVDVTKTDVTKYTPELERMRNKQRNWETVVQVLGLRAQIMGIRQLKTETVDLSGYQFGESYVNKHRVWTFEFEVEFENLYLQDRDTYGTLKSDFSHTPILLGLDETAQPPMPLFYTDGQNKNIYFISIESN